MKLLFVFTGGTIGSSISGDYISTDKNKPHLLLESYKARYGLSADYDVTQPYTKLSENNNGKTFRTLASAIEPYLSNAYDGILVMHGTDTLQYTAAALSYAFGDCATPVCLVSSNYPIEDSRANGLTNLHAAICFISQSHKSGVWVSYQNQHELPKIHRASRLLAGQAFTDNVYSIFDSYFGSFDESWHFHANPAFSQAEDQIAPLPYKYLEQTCDTILRIESYPGMSYPPIGSNINCILHGSFHSGTINTDLSSYREFFQTAYKKGIPVYLTGTPGGTSYESTKLFSELHIRPLMGISPVAAYMKLWMASSAGLSVDAIMNHSLGGDIIY